MDPLRVPLQQVELVLLDGLVDDVEVALVDPALLADGVHPGLQLGVVRGVRDDESVHARVVEVPLRRRSLHAEGQAAGRGAVRHEHLVVARQQRTVLGAARGDVVLGLDALRVHPERASRARCDGEGEVAHGQLDGQLDQRRARGRNGDGGPIQPRRRVGRHVDVDPRGLVLPPEDVTRRPGRERIRVTPVARGQIDVGHAEYLDAVLADGGAIGADQVGHGHTDLVQRLIAGADHELHGLELVPGSAELRHLGRAGRVIEHDLGRAVDEPRIPRDRAAGR